MQGDVDDVGPVLRLAADDERLREVQPDDLGANLHLERRDVGRNVGGVLPLHEAGGHHAAALRDDRRHFRRREPGSDERWTDPSDASVP